MFFCQLSRRFVCVFALLLIGYVPTAFSEDIFLYRNPITSAFFKQNGTDYETLLSRWRDYLKEKESKRYREVNRRQLLEGLPKGTLIIASGILLDRQEREAIDRYIQSGNGLIATWGMGARDGTGAWAGYQFLESVFQIKVNTLVKRTDDLWFLNFYGNSPISFPVDAGRRFFLGKTAESPITFSGTFVSGEMSNWNREAGTAIQGAIAHLEEKGSRRVYLGFPESTWEYLPPDQFFPFLDASLDWVSHHSRVFKGNWPSGFQSAHLLEMDTEDKFENAIHFAKDLQAASARGTFYSLTSISRKHPELLKQLASNHEIGYHGDVHIGFKGKSEEEQLRRLRNMTGQMKDSAGDAITSSITGFRAPTESYDATTNRLLQDIGMLHHVTHPSSSDARVPFFCGHENTHRDRQLICIPRTQKDDLNLQGSKLTHEEAKKLITDDLLSVMRMGGLGVLSIHSQNYGDNGSMAYAVPFYLQHLRNNKGNAWIASGGEIADWWRNRDRLLLQVNDLDTQGKIQFTVTPGKTLSGATIYFTNPSKGQTLKKVSQIQGPQSSFSVRAIDDYRSAIIFERLSPGDYLLTAEF